MEDDNQLSSSRLLEALAGIPGKEANETTSFYPSRIECSYITDFRNDWVS